LCFGLQEFYYRFYKYSEFKDLLAPFFSSETLEVGPYLKLGLPTTLMACLAWWYAEMITIFAGLLGVKELAAQVVIINVMTLVYMPSDGVKFAASGMVGNMIGSRNVKQA
jgi:Na+-driven multidrug efflux pump